MRMLNGPKKQFDIVKVDIEIECIRDSGYRLHFEEHLRTTTTDLYTKRLVIFP